LASSDIIGCPNTSRRKRVRLDAGEGLRDHPRIRAQGFDKFRAALAAAAAVLAVLAAPAAHADASAYFGATISGEAYGETGTAPLNQTAWNRFEKDAGRKVAILNMHQSWCSFDPTQMNDTHARGAIPIVTMGLPGGVSLEEVATGGQDSAIRKWAKAAKAWAHPFFFAPWWEMNGNWYPWGRSPYFVQAWRRFHDLVVAEGATNVTWAWVPNNLSHIALSDPAPYYPGNEYVDWTGIDGYNWGLNLAQPDRWKTEDQVLDEAIERIEEIENPQNLPEFQHKPMIILENAASELGGNKTDWIDEVLGTYLPHHPQIKAYMWFNWNEEKPNGFRPDWPIESSATAQQAFRRGIQSDYYRQPPAMKDLTKVPPPPTLAGGEAPRPGDLSPAGHNAVTPQAAVAPDGSATIVWSAEGDGGFQVFMRRIAPDGTGGAVVPLSVPGGDALSPQVAVAPDGTATIVWSRFAGEKFVVQDRRVAPDGTLDEVKSLSSTAVETNPGRNALSPQVAVAADGTATVVWKRFNDFLFQVKERRIAPDGTVEEAAAHTLSAKAEPEEEEHDAVEPRVAVAPDGTATVVWSRYDGSNTIVQGSRVAPDGIPAGGVANLSAAGQNAVEPHLVVAPDGTATVVWARSNGADTIIQERQIDASGVPKATTNDLSASGQSAAEPQIALGPDSSSTVVWDRSDGSNFIVQKRRISAAGVPGATTTSLSASGRDAAEPQVAIRPDGTATVVWSRFDGSNFIVQRRRLAADGTPAATTDNLSTSGRGAAAVAVAPGSGTAVWTRFNGADDIVQASIAVLPAVPVAQLTPPSRDFGSIRVGSGSSPSQAFTIFNSGTAPLSIASISVAGRDADQFSLEGTGSCSGAPLPPGGDCEFTAVFAPSEAGPQSALIEVSSNAGSSSASLSGTGLEPSKPTTNTRSSRSTAAVDNSFAVGKPILNRKKGTAKLPVTLPGAGTLTSAGSGVATVPVSDPKTVKLPIRARGRKLSALNAKGTVVLKLRLTFVPVGGDPNAKTTRLRLRKAS
jgi:hypothetical protein